MAWLDAEDTQSAALFESECKQGHAWERYVAQFLRLQGFEVEVGEQTIGGLAERARYAGIVDITCEGVLIECKSRRMRFTGPEDVLYRSLLVDTVSGWKDKPEKPRVIINVSRVTGAMIWLPVKSSRKDWREGQAFDRVRRIKERFFYCPIKHWQPIDTLVGYMHQLKAHKA